MASKRHQRRLTERHQCTDKKAYPDLDTAKNAIWHHRRHCSATEALYALRGKTLVPYHCKICGQYHNGHMNTRRMARTD